MDKLGITIKSKKIKKLVNINLLISFIISISGIITLYIHNTYFISFYLLDASIIIFRTGLLYGIFSIIFGIFFANYLNFE